jgi:hypothetical protein
MKMISAGAGLGVEVKDYRVIFVPRERQGSDTVARFRLVGFGANGCSGQSRQVGRSILRSGQGCPRSVGMSDHQERHRPPDNLAGHEILQGLRSQ